ncbi:MAG: bile acid:sodium symporter [Deltaproteobacteria bacterium]|nr:bile acid:sodium symporter [Deltaproteobacteria bacterium]
MTLTSVAVTLMVVLLMLSLGLELRLQDLVAGASRRGAFIGGLALNLLALPLLVLAFGETGAVSADVIVGLLIIAVAPGGPVGAGMARLSSADLGFSVALLTALGVLSVVTAPLAVVFGLSGTALLVPMLTTLVLCQLAPLTLGMAARRAWPARAASAAGPVRKAATALLLLIVVGMVGQHLGRLLAAPLGVHLAVVIPLSLLLGPVVLGVGPILRGLLMVTAVRNLSVALLLSDRYFSSAETQTVVLVASWWILVLPMVAAAWAGRRAAEAAA